MAGQSFEFLVLSCLIIGGFVLGILRDFKGLLCPVGIIERVSLEVVGVWGFVGNMMVSGRPVVFQWWMGWVAGVRYCTAHNWWFYAGGFILVVT